MEGSKQLPAKRMKSKVPSENAKAFFEDGGFDEVEASGRTVAGSKIKEREHYVRDPKGSCTHGHGVGEVKTYVEGGVATTKSKPCWCPEFVAVTPTIPHIFFTLMILAR